MNKSTIIASCISAIAMSADPLWYDLQDEMQGLVKQQQNTDKMQLELLSSVML